MAEISWNPNIRIVDLSLVASTPGQIIHSIPSTGAVRIFNQGSGLWTGTITFGEMDEMETGQQIEAFIATLNGSQNTTRIPLVNIKQFSTSTSPTQFRNAKTGHYYIYKNRLILSYGGSAVFPDFPISPNETILPATSILVRQRPDSQVILRHRPDSYGPWSLSFTEVI